MARMKRKTCKGCQAWDADGIEIPGKISGKDVTLHHCKRRCPQIIWVFGGNCTPDVATTFPATTADNYCMEFEKLES